MNDSLKIKIPSNYYNISVLNDVLAPYNLKIHADPVTGKLHVFCVVLSLFRAHNLMLYGTHVVDGVIIGTQRCSLCTRSCLSILTRGCPQLRTGTVNPPPPSFIRLLLQAVPVITECCIPSTV